MTPADAAVIIAALIAWLLRELVPEVARIIAANAKDKRAAKLKAGAR